MKERSERNQRFHFNSIEVKQCSSVVRNITLIVKQRSDHS